MMERHMHPYKIRLHVFRLPEAVLKFETAIVQLHTWYR